MEVLDGGGNRLGASDRYDVYSDSKVTRVLVCSSVTAHLTGTTTGTTSKLVMLNLKIFQLCALLLERIS